MDYEREPGAPELKKFLVSFRRHGEKYEMDVIAASPARAEGLLKLDRPEAEILTTTEIGPHQR